jgi:hypothetical protein
MVAQGPGPAQSSIHNDIYVLLLTYLEPLITRLGRNLGIDEHNARVNSQNGLIGAKAGN